MELNHLVVPCCWECPHTAQQAGLLPALHCWSSARQWGWKLELSPLCLQAELSDGEDGKQGVLSGFPPCIHFGAVTGFEVILSCRRLRGRLRAICAFAMLVCTKKWSPKTKPSIIVGVGSASSTIAPANASICCVAEMWLRVAQLLRFLTLFEHQP